jgi:membrane protein
VKPSQFGYPLTGYFGEVGRLTSGRTNDRGLLGQLRQIKTEMSDDNLTLVAAGVAFYSMLAIFPAIIAVVTVYALIATPEQIEHQIRPLLKTLPPGAADLLLAPLTSAAKDSGGLTVGLIVSLLGTLWAASGGVSALMTGLNVIYGAHEGRNFVKLKARALSLTLVGMLAAIVALVLVAAFPVVLRHLGLAPAAALGAQVARWVVLAALIALGNSVLYRFGPDRHDVRWRPVSVGTITALLVWVLASIGFSFYVSNFGNYNKAYGSLAAVIVLLLWLYLSAFAILLGAEIDAVRAERHAPAEPERVDSDRLAQEPAGTGSDRPRRERKEQA